MNILVEKAFQSLAVTCNPSGLHPLDEDRIKVTLKTLHKKGIEIDVKKLESYLILNGWESAPVKDILKWASSISSGGRVQLKQKSFAPSEKEIWEELNA